MSPCDGILRISADFLREARRLFGRFRLPSEISGPTGPAFPVEVRGRFDGIALAVGDGHCRLESFRPTTADAAGHGCILLSRQAFTDACRADPGTWVELAACDAGRDSAMRLRLRSGGVWMESFHPPAGCQPLAAPALPEGDALRLPARTLEALALVAPFADWNAPAGLWRRGVCFSPAAGGRLIARDGRRLACVPARVPPQGFVLPLGAVRVLLHPDFLGYENEVTLPLVGAAPRVMFRAWDHLLVTPSLPAGRLENDARLQEDSGGGVRLPLAAVCRERLLGWLRSLRDPRMPVTLEWREDGWLSVRQGRDCETHARLQLAVGFRDPWPTGLQPRLVLAPRDLAAALNLGGTLGIAVVRGGRVSLCCRDSGGAFCQIASLARAAGGGGGAGGAGQRPAA